MLIISFNIKKHGFLGLSTKSLGTSGLNAMFKYKLICLPSIHFLISPLRNDLLQAIEGSRRNEQDVCGVDRDVLASRRARSLLRHVDHTPLQDLK